MNDLQFRSCNEDDLVPVELFMRQGFSLMPHDVARLVEVFGLRNFYVVYQDKEPVGSLIEVPVQQCIGGTLAPAVATTYGTIGLTFRGKGISSRLYREMLYRFYQRGITHTVAYPASMGFFRRLGYEVGGLRYHYHLHPCSRIDNSRDLTVSMISSFDHIHAMSHAYSSRTNGALVRSEEFWRLLTHPAKGTVEAVLVSQDAAPQGYILVVRSQTELRIADYCIRSSAAGRSLLTAVNDLRIPSLSVCWDGPALDWFVHLLPDLSVAVRGRDEWMVRLVDVAGSLERRRYPQALSACIPIVVRDQFLPWNDGPMILHITNGALTVERPTTASRHSLHIGVGLLGAMHTGHLTATALSELGMITGASGFIADLNTAFNSPPPWMPDVF